MLFRLFLFTIFVFLGGCGLFNGESGSESGVESGGSKSYSVNLIDGEGSPVSPAFLTVKVDRNGNGKFDVEDGELFLAVSDSLGNVRLELPTKVLKLPALVEVKADGFSRRILRLERLSDLPPSISLFKMEEATVKETQGGVIVEGQGVEIQVPLQREGNSNNLRAQLYYLNPALFPLQMPGGFFGYDGRDQILSTGGAFEVKFYSSDGTPLELGSGNYKVAVKIPPELLVGISDLEPSTPQVEVPLWYFDEKRGVWRKYKELGVVVDSAGEPVSLSGIEAAVREGRELYLKGGVEHFSWLNVDVGAPITVITGRLKRIPKICLVPGTRCFVATCGENWRGHSSSYIHKDGYFSLPVPVKNGFSGKPVANLDKALDGLRRIAGKFLLDPSLLTSDVCESERILLKELLLNEIEAIRRINWKYYKASGVKEFLNAIYVLSTGTGNIPKQTYETINERLDKAEELVSQGRLEEAFKAIEDINRTYGENLTAEALNAYAKELQKASLNTIFSGLVDGLSAVDKCMLSSWKFMKKNPRFAACITNGLQSGITVRNLINNFSSAYQGIKDKDFWEVAGSSAATFGMGLGTDGEEVYWDIVGDFTDLAVECFRGEGLENYFADCSKASNFMDRFAAWATFFADVGYGLIEVSDANYKAEGALFSSRIDTEIGAFRLRLKNFLRKLRDEGYSLECLNLDSLIEEFSDVKEGQKFYYQDCPPGSEEKEVDVPEPTDGDYLNELFKAIWEENLALSSPYKKYYSVKRDSFEELPSLPSDIDTFLSDLFNGNGYYLNRLYLYVESPFGTFRKPINTITSEGIPTYEIPSPPFAGLLSSGRYLSGWIGEVELPENFIEINTVPFILDVSIEGDEFSIDRLMGYVAVKKPGGGWATTGLNFETMCSVEGSSARCTFEIPKAYFSEGELKLKVYPGFVLKHESGKKFRYYPGLKELTVKEGDREVELTFSPQGSYYVKSVEVEAPSAVEPLKEYTLKAKAYLEIYGVRAPEDVEFTWYFNYKKIGKGDELRWKAPDRLTLRSLSSSANSFLLKVCYRENCAYDFEPVKVVIPNSPPQVKLLAPDLIPSGQDSVNLKVEASDPDGDSLSYTWYSTGGGEVKAEGDSASVSFKHLSFDYFSRVCVAVSDGLSEVVKCKKVKVERELPPPKVRKVNYTLRGKFAPQSVEFKVLSSVPLGHKVVKYLFDFDGDGRWDFEGEDSNVKHTFLKAGKYEVRVAVKDDIGRISEPYSVSFELKELDLSTVDVSVSVAGFEEEIVEIQAQVEGLNGLGLKYYWDFNGDGVWDEVSTSSRALFILPLSLFDRASKLSVSISSLYGRVERELPITEVKPLIRLTPSVSSGSAPLDVNFSVSVVSPGRKVKEYRFDFDGDGKFDLVSAKPEASYTYSTPGDYRVIVGVLLNSGELLTADSTITVYSGSSNQLTLHLPSGGFPVVLLDDSMDMIGWIASDNDGVAKFEEVYSPINFEVIFYPGVKANGSMVLASVLHTAKKNGCSINYAQIVKERRISLSDFNRFLGCSNLGSLFLGYSPDDYDSNRDGFLSLKEILELFTAVLDGSKNPVLPDNRKNGTLEVGELYGRYLSLKRLPNNGTSLKVLAVKGASTGEYFVSPEVLLPSELLLPNRAVEVEFNSDGGCGQLIMSVGNVVAYRGFKEGETLKELLFIYTSSPYNLYSFYVGKPECGGGIKALSFVSLTSDSLNFDLTSFDGVETVKLNLSDFDSVNVELLDSSATLLSYRDWTNPQELLFPKDFRGDIFIRLTKMEGDRFFTEFFLPYRGGDVDDRDFVFRLSAEVEDGEASFQGEDADSLNSLIYTYRATCRFDTGELSEIDYRLIQLKTDEPIERFEPALPDEVKGVLSLISDNISWEDESFGAVDLIDSFSSKEIVELFLSDSYVPSREYWVK